MLSEDRDHHIFQSSPHHRPNHVLINEYPPGVGIMPHKVSPYAAMSRCPMLIYHRMAQHTGLWFAPLAWVLAFA